MIDPTNELSIKITELDKIYFPNAGELLASEVLKLV